MPKNGRPRVPSTTKSLYIRNAAQNVRVVGFKPLIPPSLLQEEQPSTDISLHTVLSSREQVANVVSKADDRILCIVGPCSIHDKKAALEYAKKLKEMSEIDVIKENLLIVMRVYFEKPRTTVGWKGLINDPMLDGSFQINKGLRLARQILLDINELGLPCGVEFLDSLSPQFISDQVSWGAIGARTTESQIHRELASGLSCPIGFKNGTMGTVKLATDAILSATCPHHFLGVNDQGLAAIVETKGNPHCHVILRGGVDSTNFDAASVADALKTLQDAVGDEPYNGLMIDCSHGNSQKNYLNQPKVLQNIAEQVAAGNENIIGVMIESNLVAGNQKLDVGVTDPKCLVYGKSVTDGCVDLTMTEEMLTNLAKAVATRRELKNKKTA